MTHKDNSMVIEHLEMAIKAAQDEEMSASEIMGLLFYYAHNIAQEARENAMRDQASSFEESLLAE